MEIESIILKNKGKSICFDTSYFSYSDIRNTYDINNLFYLILNDNGEQHCVSLSLLMLETEIGNCTTWTEVRNSLNNLILESYEDVPPMVDRKLTRIEGHVYSKPYQLDITNNVYPLIINALHGNDLIVDYGTADVPTLRNVDTLKWRLNEIIIHKADRCDLDVNLDNCISVVAGNIHYNKVFEDELYVYDGTNSLTHIANHIPEMNQTSIMLIDTTPWGGHTNIKISDTERLTVGSTTDLGKFRLSIDNVDSLYNKTPLLVLGGRLFLPDEFAIINDNIIEFDLNKFDFNGIMLNNQYFQGGYLRHTPNLRYRLNTKALLDMFWDEEFYQAFIVLVDTPNLNCYKDDNICKLHDNLAKCTSDINNGILMRKGTREIIHYVRTLKADNRIFSFDSSWNCFITVEDEKDNLGTYGYMENDIRYVEESPLSTFSKRKELPYGRHINNDYFSMVHITL